MARQESLSLVGVDDPSIRHPLWDGKYTMGYGREAIFRVADADAAPIHAQLVVSHGHVTVSDLSTPVGTRVNDRLIGGPAPLRPDDVLTVGRSRYRLLGPRRHEVLILGGGFAGAYVGLALQKRLGARRDVGLTLISRDNYLLFQPMLAELVSGNVETQHILTPLRSLLPGVQVLAGEVRSIDAEHRAVMISTGLKGREYPIAYESLVVALGSVTDLSRFPGLTEHAFLAKSVRDAFVLRNHALDMLEKADAEGDPAERARLLTFVVAGGGFSGVEIVAELGDLLHDSLRYYPGIDRREIRIVLVQSAKRILPEVGESLAAFATRKLRQKDIEVRLGSGVSALTPHEATLRDGSKIPTRTLVATIGNRPHPIASSLPCTRTEHGALQTNEYLETNVPGIYALGDVAAVPDLKHGGTCPPTAQYAIRQARYLAHNLLAAIDGGPKQAFAFGGLGQLASLGYGSAVAEVMGLRLEGWVAWWLWRAVYLSKLPSRERQARVLADWVLGSLLPRDTVRLNLDRASSLLRLHYQPGQRIVEQGEVSARFYVVLKGEVVVERELPDGELAQLATLGEGQHFGVGALVQGGYRRVSVVARTPVDLLALERDDFLALTASGALMSAQDDVTDESAIATAG
jgi:NADH dehydrogenase